MHTDKHGCRALILIACYVGLASGANSQVTVQRDAALRETTYSIEQASCRISWTIFESELNRGGIRVPFDCQTWFSIRRKE